MPASHEPPPGAIKSLAGLKQLTLPMAPGDPRTVNAFLIPDQDGYVLVDCGVEAASSWRTLNEQLRRLRVPLGAVKTLVITHAHPDHYGLALRLREHSPASIWMHVHDAAILETRARDRSAFRQALIVWLRRHGFPTVEADEVASAVETRAAAHAINPDRLLTGPMELTCGRFYFQIFPTPGHTPGHVCLFEPRHRLLICGDHILEHLYPNVGLQPDWPDNPMGQYLRSLRELTQLEVDLALPGHGRAFSSVAERLDAILRHQLRRQAQLKALLNDTPQTAYELARQLWTVGRRSNWAQLGHRRRNAVATVAAHLELLAAEGVIMRLEDPVIRFTRRGS